MTLNFWANTSKKVTLIDYSPVQGFVKIGTLMLQMRFPIMYQTHPCHVLLNTIALFLSHCEGQRENLSRASRSYYQSSLPLPPFPYSLFSLISSSLKSSCMYGRTDIYLRPNIFFLIYNFLPLFISIYTLLFLFFCLILLLFN